ncbi:MAG: diheme cytochrome c [Betaproteobacteria bacterium]|nr:diheme cytochrome c [Betaproteobacteria bacterium]MCC6247381.1 diheme cytochrome c [Rubrivivax sp.]MCL4699275.1 cytochrome C [Burkholderiaceae bacterium]
MTPAPLRPAAALVLALALTAGAAFDAAASDRDRLPFDMPAAYVPECGSCHAPFPPGLLPRESWTRLMAGLDRHYGSDASIDATLRRDIETWLLRHAGRSRKVSNAPPAEDRITRSAWFEREHRRVEPATWRLPSVQNAVNCAACHEGADRGDFDDDHLRQPEGVSRAEWRAWRR